jgi:hypothetical protein
MAAILGRLGCWTTMAEDARVFTGRRGVFWITVKMRFAFDSVPTKIAAGVIRGRKEVGGGFTSDKRAAENQSSKRL